MLSKSFTYALMRRPNITWPECHLMLNRWCFAQQNLQIFTFYQAKNANLTALKAELSMPKLWFWIHIWFQKWFQVVTTVKLISFWDSRWSLLVGNWSQNCLWWIKAAKRFDAELTMHWLKFSRRAACNGSLWAAFHRKCSLDASIRETLSMTLVYS